MEHTKLFGLRPQIETARFPSTSLGASSRALAAAFDESGRLFVGAEKGLFWFDGSRFVKLSGLSSPVNAVCAAPGGVFAASGEKVYFADETGLKQAQALGEEVIALARAEDKICALTPGALWFWKNGRFEVEQEIAFGDALCMAPTPGKTVFAACGQAVLRLMAKRTRFGTMTPEMTHVPAVRFTCMAADSLGGVWCGCEAGVYAFDGKSEWVGPEVLSAFPRRPVTAIALGRKKTYVGTEGGLYIVSAENTRFYGAGRYLTGDKVYAVLPAPDEKEVWVCAEGGMSRIRFTEMPLSEKAARYEALLPLFTREDYVTGRVGVKNGDLTTGFHRISDNDGLYTADHTAAMCMKYAVTGDPAARESARRSMRALIKLQRVTGIPGFPARAYRRPGEDRFGNGDPEWHLTVDETGPLEWKGETSSDELVGHYFAGCWYFDLCADEAEKRELAECYAAITDHILSHGYTLCDADGTPTSWAHFGPQELNADDAWCWEKGVNSLEILAFLLIAYHMTGDEKYAAARRALILDHHYALNLLGYKKDDAHSSVIDDRLTFYSAVHLLRLETDPDLLRYIRLGVRRHYEYIRDDREPFFSFVYAFACGGLPEIGAAAEVLAEYPLDLASYDMTNAGRPEALPEPRTALFAEEPHLEHPLPASERVTGQLHSTARKIEGRGGGAVSPASWLAAYWLGRYFGYLCETD